MKLTTPAQQSQLDTSVEIHPRAVQEWLNDLPFLDIRKSAGLVRQYLQVLNRQPLPIHQRMELLDHLAGAYWRMLEALQATPATSGIMGQQRAAHFKALERYCQGLAFGYKIAVNDSLGSNRIFTRSKHQQHAILMAIQFLGQLLNHRYANYQRLPASLWSEIDQLYRYARQQDCHQAVLRTQRRGHVSIEQAFLEIALLKIGDPLRLANGMLWETQRYLLRRASEAELRPWADSRDDLGLFFLPAVHPEAQGCFRHGFCLDTRYLAGAIRDDLDALAQDTPVLELGFSERLRRRDARQLLEQLLQGWHQDVQRGAERKELQADAELAVGLERTFFFLNRGLAFDRHAYLQPETDTDTDIDAGALEPAWDPSKQVQYHSLQCRALNRSAGGIAVHANSLAEEAPRVGQIVAVRSHERGSEQPGVWFVGVTRWLSVEDERHFDAGVQYLAREAKPAAVRDLDRKGGGTEFHACLCADVRRDDQLWRILITPTGLFGADRQLELVYSGEHLRLRCEKLLETGWGFERFRYEPL